MYKDFHKYGMMYRMVTITLIEGDEFAKRSNEKGIRESPTPIVDEGAGYD